MNYCSDCIYNDNGRCEIYNIAVKRIVDCEEKATERPEEGYWDDEYDDYED